MIGKYRLTLILIFSGISAFCIGANTGIPENFFKEMDYIDSLNVEVKKWFRNPENSFELVFNQLEACKKNVEKKYGDQSLAYAYLLHKQGVALINLTDKTENDLQNAIRFYQQALQIRKNNLKESDSLVSPLIILGYSNIANCYLRLQNPHESLYYTLKGLNILENYEYKEAIINTQMKLNILAARTYYDIGDYDNSIKYYSAIIYYNLTSKDKTTTDNLNDWKTLALVELGGLQAWPLFATEDAIHNLLKGIEYLSLNYSDENNIYLAEAYLPLGSAYHSTENYKLSKKYYFKSIKISEKYNLPDYIFRNYINLSVLYIEEHNYDSASYFLNKSKIILENEESNDLNNWFFIYDNKADIAFGRKQYLESLEHDNKAIQCMLPDFKPKTVFDNPNLSNMAIADKPWLLSSLASKAQTYINLYRSSQNQEYLNYAYKTFLQADYLIDNIRGSFVADASKMDLVKQAKPVYEQAIETCWLLYNKFQCDSCLDQAFRYSEKSRSIILLDAVRKTAARTKLPAHLVDEEKQLNLKVNYYEKQVALQKNEDNKTPTINYYDSLLIYRRKHDAIIDTIKKKYPGYHNAIFNKKVSSPGNVKNFINDNQTFIEFFTGDKNAYAFAINKENTIFFKLGSIDSLGTWINDFNSQILHKDQRFIHSGYKIYNYLFSPIEQNFPLSKNLILVPDDILSSVSFDALVINPHKGSRIYLANFKDYMIYKHLVSLVFSASSLSETFQKPELKLHAFLGIAPTFKDDMTLDGNFFDKLETNIKEIRMVKRILGQGVLMKKETSKEKFLHEAKNYSIIHFATHAQANVENGDLSFILFGPDETQKLYAKDLYALNLNSKMVVLSACQTGKGSLKRGEGTISLARGFIYAGAASVITSLWSVRENSNSKIILKFYKGLQEGKTKASALRNAKLDYLKTITRNNQEQAHPFFWSPLVCIGDISPCQTETTFPWAYLLFGVILISISILAFRKKRI